MPSLLARGGFRLLRCGWQHGDARGGVTSVTLSSGRSIPAHLAAAWSAPARSSATSTIILLASHHAPSPQIDQDAARVDAAVPYRIHTILTDNGIQFAEQPRNRNTAWSRQMRFAMICEANDIEDRLTKPNHP